MCSLGLCLPPKYERESSSQQTPKVQEQKWLSIIYLDDQVIILTYRHEVMSQVYSANFCS